MMLNPKPSAEKTMKAIFREIWWITDGRYVPMKEMKGNEKKGVAQREVPISNHSYRTIEIGNQYHTNHRCR